MDDDTDNRTDNGTDDGMDDATEENTDSTDDGASNDTNDANDANRSIANIDPGLVLYLRTGLVEDCAVKRLGLITGSGMGVQSH